jgi:hypothetical protein
MSGVNYTLQHGPDTFEVNVAVTGGMLVEPDGTTGKVKPAGAGSLKVLGVAATDALPAGSDNPLNFAVARPFTAVYYTSVDIKVTYTNAATFGAKLIAAANGQVTPAGATPDSASIVGICTEPGGVAAGAKGRIRLLA